MGKLLQPEVLFALMAALGAVLHWVKKAYRGDVSWDFFAYWLADHPGNSSFALGALVTSVWAVIFSDSLAGMQMQMVIAGGFTLGWMLDSGINKGTAKNVEAK